MTQACAEARPALGVYVLGAVDPAEFDMVDTHLATCPECRGEIAGLADVPALLARLSPEEAYRIGVGDPADTVPGERASGGRRGPVLDLAGARRRRNMRRFLAAAAAMAVIAAGLFAGLRSPGSTRTVVVPFAAGGGGWQTAQATSQVTGASATVAYARQQWGTAVEVLASHIPVGTTCQLWVVHPDGTRTQVAAWTTARDQGRVWYAGSMPSSAGTVAKFEVTAGSTPLLTIPPA